MLKNKLKSFRHRYEMNQTEFAEFLGVGRRTYCDWESNKGNQPNTESTWQILKRLKVQMADLFYEYDDKPPMEE